MILDPLNSVTSLVFYRKVAKQGVGRSLGYLAYLSLLFSVAVGMAAKIHVMPVIQETLDWLSRSAPNLSFQDGKITSSAAGPVVLRHPRASEVAFVIDTARQEPVTHELLESQKAMAYVTMNAIYLNRGPGRLEVYDFSKAPPNPKPLVMDAEFYRRVGGSAGSVLYPIAVIGTFFLFLAWKALSSLLYSILGLALNQSMGGGLGYGSVFSLSVYAQTLVVVLQALFLFLPQRLPAAGLISLVIVMSYIGLAIKAVKEENSAPAPEEPAA